mgnify:FL=1|jgi:hypothetical protein|uniref:Uncharacterized protein n=1 Tax=Siphoviridae sp. ctNU74 TaxID=2825471 RepID=A0A8S5NZT6_9CAUD|nr:MAG TPA: hypothetical protein [Siphoviridae sp. ctNU74]
MSILGFFKKHEKLETYEKRTEPKAKIIPFPEREKKGLEELKLINITHPVKKSARLGNR